MTKPFWEDKNVVSADIGKKRFDKPKRKRSKKTSRRKKRR